MPVPVCGLQLMLVPLRTQVCVDAGSVLHAPEALSDHEAGGLMEATLTAYLNIFEIGGAKSGQMVLIHGGGSGVGTQVAPLTSPA